MTHAFWDWWQHLPRMIDPNLFEIGSFQLRYYGLMYIVAFALTYGLLVYRSKKDGFTWFTPERIQDLMVWLIAGTILGGRLGYVLFYDLSFFAAHPLKIFLPFDLSEGFRLTGISGMSYHGGLIGLLLAGWAGTRSAGLGFRQMADLFAPAAPLGYTFGRLGNFINGELWGKPTDVPWAFEVPDEVFPGFEPGDEVLHPTMLYEAALEGLVLFLVLWWFSSKERPSKRWRRSPKRRARRCSNWRCNGCWPSRRSTL